MTNYNGLPRSYWQSQIERIQRLRAQIVSRSAPSTGRLIPTEDDLVIGEGRSLKLAVMFLDISGFSRRPSGTPAEQALLLRVLNLFFSEMLKIAEDYGGVVEKNTGDGLMVYFENEGGVTANAASKRAVATALTMMAANDFLIKPILEVTPTDPIKFRISIDYGQVTIARLGAARRFNANVAIGSTANFASKMLAQAQPGEIVLGQFAKDQLPADWQRDFVELITTDTGWTYGPFKTLPYSLYRYTGRWKNLA